MPDERNSLKVAIDANFGADAGGIRQATIGLVHALGELDGPERYDIVVGTEEVHQLIEPHLGSSQRICRRPEPARSSGIQARARRHFRYRLRQAMRDELRPWPAPARSDGFIESLGAEVLHIPTQAFSVCALPTIYNPWDLQHRHFPQFFTPDDLAYRDAIYGVGCRLSQTIAVASEWVKDDIVSHLAVDPRKVQVIPSAAPTDLYHEATTETIAALRLRHELPPRFFLYPARTWPHKNHGALFEAIAMLRDQHGMQVHVVCTGGVDERSWPNLETTIERLGVLKNVHLLGFVSDDDLRALYELADALVFPSLYEGLGQPPLEALTCGCAVASSNATSLPEVVGDAGLLFDPYQPRSIADALLDLLRNPDLVRELEARGRARSRFFTWERTAKAYRAVYRRAAGRQLDDDDRSLLEVPSENLTVTPRPATPGRA